MSLTRISEFAPDGMQIKSPGGFTFDPQQVTGLEAYSDASDPRLIIHLQGTSVTIRFHRNTNGGSADVYGLAENIRKATEGLA